MHHCTQCSAPITPGTEVEVNELLYHKACAPCGRLVWSDSDGVLEVWEPCEDVDVMDRFDEDHDTW
jgi:hypothetical protein